MNLKKKLREFLSLARKSDGGFTLVELIVVIAIVAVLGGVAVPAYSGYIEKTNKTADMSLVSEAAHALSLHYYRTGGEQGGYVVLGEGANADAFGDAAMIAAFGDNWRDIVKLKYDGWTDNGILSTVASLSEDQIAAINNSPFLKNNSVSDLMGSVQGLTSKATDFLVSKESNPANVYNKLGQYLGDGFYQFCADKGITSSDGQFTNASSTQLSNLMSLYVAEGMGNLTQSDYDTVLASSIFGREAAEEEGYTMSEGVNLTTYYAAQYALFNSIASATGAEGQSRLEAVDTALGNASNMGEVESALNSFFNSSDSASDTAFKDSVMKNYANNSFYDDAKAITATLGAASDVSGNYYSDASDLKDPNFLSSGAVANGLSSYITAASALGNGNINLPSVGEGQILLLIGAGSPVVASSNHEAYPVE